LDQVSSFWFDAAPRRSAWFLANTMLPVSVVRIACWLMAISILGAVAGCAEGSFELASGSRLPKWFDLPQGMARNGATVTMDTYLFPIERSVFTLKSTNGVTISVVTAHRVGGYDQPKQLRNPPPGYPEGYPSYEVLTSGGKIDIVEFRRMEPVFYTSDDASVWKELGRPGRSKAPVR
jgi:hypothetical protein